MIEAGSCTPPFWDESGVNTNPSLTNHSSSTYFRTEVVGAESKELKTFTCTSQQQHRDKYD